MQNCKLNNIKHRSQVDFDDVELMLKHAAKYHFGHCDIICKTVH